MGRGRQRQRERGSENAIFDIDFVSVYFLSLVWAVKNLRCFYLFGLVYSS